MEESSEKRVDNSTIQAIEQAFNPQLVVDKIEIKIKIDFLNLWSPYRLIFSKKKKTHDVVHKIKTLSKLKIK